MASEQDIVDANRPCQQRSYAVESCQNPGIHFLNDLLKAIVQGLLGI